MLYIQFTNILCFLFYDKYTTVIKHPMIVLFYFLFQYIIKNLILTSYAVFTIGWFHYRCYFRVPTEFKKKNSWPFCYSTLKYNCIINNFYEFICYRLLIQHYLISKTITQRNHDFLMNSWHIDTQYFWSTKITQNYQHRFSYTNINNTKWKIHINK